MAIETTNPTTHADDELEVAENIQTTNNMAAAPANEAISEISGAASTADNDILDLDEALNPLDQDNVSTMIVVDNRTEAELDLVAPTSDELALTADFAATDAGAVDENVLSTDLELGEAAPPLEIEQTQFLQTAAPAVETTDQPIAQTIEEQPTAAPPPSAAVGGQPDSFANTLVDAAVNLTSGVVGAAISGFFGQSEAKSETPAVQPPAAPAQPAPETADERAAAAPQPTSEAAGQDVSQEADTATAMDTATVAEPPAAQIEARTPPPRVVKLKLNPNAPARPAAPPAPSVETANTAAPAARPSSERKPARPAAAPPASFTPVAPADAEEASPGDMMDFGAILEQFEQEQARFREGDLVQGKVVGVSDRGVLIDFGYKSEGVVAQAEFLQDGELTVKPGDEVEVTVRRMDNGEGLPELSRSEAVKMRMWDTLEAAHRDGTPVTGRVVDRTKGGLNVDIGGIEAFLPGSQIDSRPVRNLDVYRGKDIEARVIKFNRKRQNVVLSRKVIVDELVNAQKSQTLNDIREGYIVEGNVKSLTDYGAFVDLGGIDGLLHVTDMSWGRVEKPSDMFKPGDDVQVKVLKFDRQKERVSLGYKQLIPDPWSSVEERYPIGQRLRGKVSSITDYGAFVELEPGVEGLVHVSEMTWSKRAKHPKNIVHVGEDVDVQVLRIDQRDRRVSLGIKQVQSNPWETIYERYPVGTRVKGRVRNMTDFGAFVEIEEGVDGLVHVSDISWSKKIKHPSEVLKKNQEVEAVVTGINVEGRRMSLSMKELQPSAWDQFVTDHKPGDVVRGRISRFAGFGVFVELADDLEGLCHISELSEERIEKPEKVFEIGQEMDFKILRIEQDAKKIGLSARAVGREDEPAMDTKSYSSEAKSGMASLGELAKLRSPERR